MLQCMRHRRGMWERSEGWLKAGDWGRRECAVCDFIVYRYKARKYLTQAP